MMQTIVNDGIYSDFAHALGHAISENQFAIDYLKQSDLTDVALDSLYKNGFYAKIVDKIVHDAMRKGFYFEGLSDAEQKAIGSELTRIKAVSKLTNALAMARLYGRSFVFKGVKGSDFESALMVKQGSLSWLAIEQPKYFKIERGTNIRSLDDTSGEKGKPEFWSYRPDGKTKQKIHFSHLVEVENKSSTGQPVSVLQKVNDIVGNFLSATRETVGLIKDAKTDVIKTPNLGEKLHTSPAETVGRYNAINNLKGNSGMIILDKEEDYDSKSYAFGGLNDLILTLGQHVSAVADIPFTILFGRTAGGLNQSNEQDVRTWYDTVSTYQEQHVKPLLMQVIDLVCISLFGSIKQYDVKFNPLWQMDEKTRADVEKSNSERDKTYLELGIINEYSIAQQLIQDGTYTNIDQAHLDSLKAVSEKP